MTAYLRIPLLLLVFWLAGCATEPHRDVTLSMQGQDAIEAGDMKTAEALLKEALDVNPDSPYALTNLSRLYIKQGRYDLARPLCEKVVARESNAEAGAEESQEMAHLIQVARENLEFIDREEAIDRELLALEPAAPSTAAVEASPTATPLVREEPPVPVMVATSTRASPASRYRVQLGAFKSRASAERLGQRLSQGYTDLMREKEVLLTNVNGLTRVQVGPYRNMSEATDACRTFSRDGLRCFPKAP